jgi:hypothetical protein
LNNLDGPYPLLANDYPLPGKMSRQRHIWDLAGEKGSVSEFLELLLGEKFSIRQTGPHILQVDDALDLGLQGLADLVQEGGQRPIVGGLLDPGRLRGSRKAP